MRVLFVYPNLRTQLGVNHGLASLSACLREAGHETRLLNLHEELAPLPDDAQIYRTIAAWRPGLVAFSCLSMQYPEGLRIARGLRARARAEGDQLPALIVGGIHATMVPEQVMADGVWDHVGVGECEHALVALADSIERGEQRDDLAGFLSWKGARRPEAGPCDEALWRRNPLAELPQPALLPRPDYELFDVARILERKNGWFSLMSGRGCPYRCTYCLNQPLVDRYREDLGRSASELGYCRQRSPEQMVEEIRWILARHPGVQTFILDDDLFTLDRAHAEGFARAYAEAGFPQPWVANAHVRQLDAGLARALAEGGCRILKLGIESGSERVRREILGRPMSDASILETVRCAEEQGLSTSGFLMVGMPGETHDERLQTVDLVARSGLSRFRTALFYPFPGTESHRLAVEGGFLREERAPALTDFTETSCLDFGEEENLFLEKLAACMTWFVNARMPQDGGATAAQRFRPWVERVLAMDRPSWEAFRAGVRELDASLSREASAAGELHYAIRYHAFMGVRSDRFPAGARAAEWDVAAAAAEAAH